MPHDLICLACPNGCHLLTDERTDCLLSFEGHQCERGLDFARTFFSEQRIEVTAGERTEVPSEDRLKEIAAFWGITFKALRPRLIPAGSPERTLFRTVIQDDQGGRFVLERIPAAARYSKLRITRTLAFLFKRGLSNIVPYRAGDNNQYHLQGNGALWQMSPFIPGIPLDRERYLYEGWRAAPLAHFLIDLRRASEGIPYFSLEETFSLKSYILTLVCRMESHAPSLLPRLRRTLAFLEQEFWDVHDRLPIAFCHGDYHPLNIVWGRREIRAVIDWEFAGPKPEIYDLANMVGCLGVEHPSSLKGDLVINLIGRLKTAGLYAEISWNSFTAFIVALRFAWLSEWLRKDDREMVGLELDYMDLLIQNRELLERNWEACSRRVAGWKEDS